MFIARILSITRQLLRGSMGSRPAKHGNGVLNSSANGPAGGLYTIPALSRWSIINTPLPAPDKISTIHVYDFDNTLFQTPLPNPRLWSSTTLGRLGSPDIFVNGGWWHDSRILAATGDGVEREEPRAWDGWWNEKIVELVQLSMKQKDALCVLLTGRSERGFSDLIKRIVTSKGLKFDMIGLKPEVGPNSVKFENTMLFKQAFLTAVMETYRHAQEIRIYEDRPKHVSGFRTFLDKYNERQKAIRDKPSRGPIAAEVIQVADISTNLDPVVEVAEIQHLINNHNLLVDSRSKRGRSERLTIRKKVFFTSYMIQPDTTKRLIELAGPYLPDGEVKYQANAVIITANQPCPPGILEKVGGMHSKMRWSVAGFGSWDNNLWAVSLQPVPASAPYHTDSTIPSVVIATRGIARPFDVNRIQQWQPIPPEKSFVLETEVGEKVMLFIEPEDASDDENNSFGSRAKRKHPKSFGDDRQQRSGSGGYGQNNSRGYHTSNHAARGGNRGGFRGGPSNRGHRGTPRGRGNGRGGRGGRGGYRSLDDLGARDGQGGVSYDDNFPSLGSHQPPPQPTAPSQQSQQWPSSGNFGSGAPDLQQLY